MADPPFQVGSGGNASLEEVWRGKKTWNIKTTEALHSFWRPNSPILTWMYLSFGVCKCPFVSAVGGGACWWWQRPIAGLPWSNRGNAERRRVRTPLVRGLFGGQEGEVTLGQRHTVARAFSLLIIRALSQKRHARARARTARCSVQRHTDSYKHTQCALSR